MVRCVTLFRVIFKINENRFPIVWDISKGIKLEYKEGLAGLGGAHTLGALHSTIRTASTHTTSVGTSGDSVPRLSFVQSVQANTPMEVSIV